MPKKSERVLSTDRQIAGAKAPSGRRVAYRIAGAPNLVLRVTGTGVKTWGFWLQDPKTDRWRLVTIGRYPEFTLANAKERAHLAASARATGENPFADNVAVLTFRELSERYIERHAKAKKRSWAEDARKLKVDLVPALGGHVVAEITKADIVLVLDTITDRGAGILANRTLALLRKLFNWAVSEGYTTANPAQGLAMRATETARERTLSHNEIQEFWRGLDGTGFDPVTADVLRLQLLLGARVREITDMQKAELELDGASPLWRLPKARAKGGRDVPRPLPHGALEIVLRRLATSPDASPYVFALPADWGKPITSAAPGRAVLRAARRGQLPAEFTPHDLRRTMATGLAELGISETVAKKNLGHAPQRSDLLGSVYNRHSYMNEMRLALEAWERHVMTIVAGREPASNGVGLRLHPST